MGAVVAVIIASIDKRKYRLLVYIYLKYSGDVVSSTANAKDIVDLP